MPIPSKRTIIPENTRNFGHFGDTIDIPPLTDIQLKSYARFLQYDVAVDKRELMGIEGVLREIFPIESYDKTIRLRYLRYELGKPRFGPDECRQLRLTYGRPFKVWLRLEKDQPVEEEVFLGEMPIMIGGGEFIINGAERVVVSQLHRSPGVDFQEEMDGDRKLHSCRIIPERGSWIEINVTKKDFLSVRIDQSGKFSAMTLLRAMDPKYSSDAEIIREFKDFLETEEIKNNAPGKTRLIGAQVVGDVIDPQTGEIFADCGDILTEQKVDRISASNIKAVSVLGKIKDSIIMASIKDDPTKTREEALLKIYQRLRPGNPPQLEKAKELFKEKFQDASRYRLGKVGRFRLNRKFEQNVAESEMTLRPIDYLNAIRYVLKLRLREGYVDDIDHLGNRRVRTIDELAADELRKGFLKLKRTVQERMSMREQADMTPRQLINPKSISAAIEYFFGRGELSQVVDQTNPLSQLTHERRLSALGPGGLNRKRAGFDVRDVHISHYGRICPIETPEGTNIGLISHLSIYAGVDDYGFLITPYRQVKHRKLTTDVKWLRADEEARANLAPADAPTDNQKITDDRIIARHEGDFKQVVSDDVQYIDISPKQMVGVSAGLIPFLEHDDANRALMGSNMQRQAVPLLRTEAPLVGTGMERVVARDSGATVVARRSGIVESVDSARIVIKADTVSGPGDVGVDIYSLTKYQRSNQSTCVNQRPIILTSDHVEAGDVIADGPATDMGELALGRNVLVAFMIWGGYNFEDSILVSERILRDDVFTSVHIEEFECVARDTKLGPEEITQDIPNVGEEALKDLDESGIVRIGAEVKPGDILVGKITPKGEMQLSPEEKLLRAIFGEKAGEVRDTSLRVPPGVEGTIINVRVFSRKGVSKDERSKSIEETEIVRLRKDQEDEIRIIEESTMRQLKHLLVGQTAAARLSDDDSRRVLLTKGKEITEELLNEIPSSAWGRIKVENEKAEEELTRSVEALEDQAAQIREDFDKRIEKLQSGDELPPGIIKMVKVFVAIKRKLQVGDKMAGRHGNKGVLSRILPEEDMPYLADGTPVDVVLNPLGVPSRMNVGQILETHLGWAVATLGRQVSEEVKGKAGGDALRRKLKDLYPAKDMAEMVDHLSNTDVDRLAARAKSGTHVATPVFDGAAETEILSLLKQAGLPLTGQATLYDGRTGEPFAEPVTVGVMYILKLHHLVEDKIHARSTGPYSLVTQQPLGGKAQFGGQRLGEMEVWALEAYGAAYSLQEMLTVKSDDVAGRTRMYEAIVKGENVLEPGLPESFNVMIRELQSLALNVELLEETR